MADDFGYGQQTPYDQSSEHDVTVSIVLAYLAQAATIKLVQVKAVTAGSDDDAPTVDVLPLVNQVDGRGNAIKHGIINAVPVVRLQSGRCAIIIDPVVDDIGLLLVCDRDTTAVRAQLKQANPSSFRMFDAADGVYLGGVLNRVAADCYVKLQSNGYLKARDKDGHVLETSAAGFALTGDTLITGKLTVSDTITGQAAITAVGEITRGVGGSDSVTLGHHLHNLPSGGNTLPPVAGT